MKRKKKDNIQKKKDRWESKGQEEKRPLAAYSARKRKAYQATYSTLQYGHSLDSASSRTPPILPGVLPGACMHASEQVKHTKLDLDKRR